MTIIIVNPVPAKSVVKERICSSCGVTLSYTPHDVNSAVVRDYGGGSDIIKTITCPNCATVLTV